MANKVRISAPCKLNIHLDVCGRRTDGFHELISIFQLVSLADDVTVFAGGDAGTCLVTCRGIDLPADNTVTKAVAAFRQVTGIKTGVSVELIKNVPSGAGLGGGSSDAAAVLTALDHLFDTALSRDVLCRCASEIGSDVPFFIDGGAAAVGGRGETVCRIASRDDLYFVIVWPEVFCSTGKAYQLVDEAQKTADQYCCKIAFDALNSEYQKMPAEWLFFNSFFEPVARVFPAITAAVADMRSSGALFSSLTGSGSAVFGVFCDAEHANNAFTQLKRKWQYCYTVHTLSAYPEAAAER